MPDNFGGRDREPPQSVIYFRVLKNYLMSKFNMKGGGPLQNEALKKTALFSVIRAFIYNSECMRKLLSFLTLNVDTLTQYIHTIYIYTHTHTHTHTHTSNFCF